MVGLLVHISAFDRDAGEDKDRLYGTGVAVRMRSLNH